MFSPERRKLLIGFVGVGGVALVESKTGIFTGFIKNFLRTPAEEPKPLGPQVGEIVDWWQELPEEKIAELADIPPLERIGEKYLSSVSPILQGKASEAGYKLIYQYDPNDTVGRTVLAGRRQFAEELDDLGFGILVAQLRGIFKAWVPDPQDPEQKHGLYALLSDPHRNSDFILYISLLEFNPARPEDKPTWFAVDNLHYGPEYIQTKSRVAGFGLLSHIVPDPNDPPEIVHKAPQGNYDTTFSYILRTNSKDLLDLAKPGDFIYGILSSTSERGRYRQNSIDVHYLGTFIVRRFNGFQQWQSEVQR